jgi:hypothetical protein
MHGYVAIEITERELPVGKAGCTEGATTYAVGKLDVRIRLR